MALILMLAGAQTMIGKTPVPASFNFGFSQERTTLAASGFLKTETPGALVLDAPDGLRLMSTDTSRENIGFLQEFVQANGAPLAEVTVSADLIWVSNPEQPNLRPGGLILFADDLSPRSIGQSGIAFQVRQRPNNRNTLELRNGVDGVGIAGAGVAMVEVGIPFNLTVTVRRLSSGSSEVTAVYTPAGGAPATLVAPSVDAEMTRGTWFGGAGRVQNGSVAEFRNFSIR